MIKFIQKIKDLYNLSKRIDKLQKTVIKLEKKISDNVEENLKHFEEKIKQMSFAYTRDLDDAKSDYLKRYFETRMNCIQQEVTNIPRRMATMQQELKALILEKDAVEEVRD